MLQFFDKHLQIFFVGEVTGNASAKYFRLIANDNIGDPDFAVLIDGFQNASGGAPIADNVVMRETYDWQWSVIDNAPSSIFKEMPQYLAHLRLVVDEIGVAIQSQFCQCEEDLQSDGAT